MRAGRTNLKWANVVATPEVVDAVTLSPMRMLVASSSGCLTTRSMSMVVSNLPSNLGIAGDTSLHKRITLQSVSWPVPHAPCCRLQWC